MTPTPHQDLRQLATTIALKAAERIRTTTLSRRTATKSSQSDLVTEIDQASERFIVEAIESARPLDGILGEEGTEKASKSGVTWVIDPLDGTTNFVLDLPWYAVSIGVLLEGIPTVGVIVNVPQRDLYVGEIGAGAWRNDQPITVRPSRDLDTSVVAVGFDYLAQVREHQAAVVRSLLPRIADLRRLGSAALDLCHVATGQVDAYFETNVKPWDIAAGIVIAQEAGAVTTNVDGTPLEDFSSVCAANPDTHKALVELLIEANAHHVDK